MRIVLCFLLCLCTISTVAQASAVIVKRYAPDVIIADDPSWTGTLYDGKAALFDGTLIAGNRNYLVEVSIKTGSKIWLQQPGTNTASYAAGSNITLTFHGIGTNSIDALIADYKAWLTGVTYADVYGGQATVFEDSGIKVNPKSFKGMTTEQCTMKSTMTPTGCYPLPWVARLHVVGTEADAAAFKASFNANYTGFTTIVDGPIRDSKSIGTITIYRK